MPGAPIELMARTLYICYFGVREPLVQTQVLPYLRELGKLQMATGRTSDLGTPEKLKISLLTFEPGRSESDRAEFEKIRTDLLAEGIEWDWLPYHKRPSALATAWDIARGAFFIWRRIARYDVLHGRVHVPTLMGALARKFSGHRPKLLFDIRGFFPEEYTDAGIWPENGWLYRGAKRIERWLMKEADGFVVLTERAREILFPNADAKPIEIVEPSGRRSALPLRGSEIGWIDEYGRPVEVIPCCMDIARFESVSQSKRTEVRKLLGVESRQVIAYVGSLGGWYLSDDMMDFFAAAREADPNVFALILTQREIAKAADQLRARGFQDADFLVKSVSPAEVGDYLAGADVALSFIKPCYSKLSSSPTKLAEYLACGLPIISNRGVGDVDALIAENEIGILLDGLDREAYLSAISSVGALGDIRDRCRSVAEREFDLSHVAGKRYRRSYIRMTQNEDSPLVEAL